MFFTKDIFCFIVKTLSNVNIYNKIEDKTMLDIIIAKFKQLIAEYKASDFCKNAKCVREKWQTKTDNWGKELAKSGVSANMVSIFGFVIGMMAINFLAMNMYFEALVCVVVNRICDVLDGAIARTEGVSKFGIFLDICLDTVFYTGVIFGFALADSTENAVVACFWMFGFVASVVAMLAYGVVAFDSNKKKENIEKTPFYLGGVAQGIETLAAFVILCVMPFAFVPVGIALGCWCLAKALVIVSSAYYKLVIQNKSSK